MRRYSPTNALLLEASYLYAQSIELRKKFIECNLQLMDLQRSGCPEAQAHELRDRIFGYRIEIESLRIRAQRLIDKAKQITTLNTGIQIRAWREGETPTKSATGC